MGPPSTGAHEGEGPQALVACAELAQRQELLPTIIWTKLKSPNRVRRRSVGVGQRRGAQEMGRDSAARLEERRERVTPHACVCASYAQTEQRQGNRQETQAETDKRQRNDAQDALSPPWVTGGAMAGG